MNKEQYEQAITVINMLWTIGVIRFDDAQRIMVACQERYSIHIYQKIKKEREEKDASREQVQQTPEG